MISKLPEKMKLMVCGSRDIVDEKFVMDAIDEYVGCIINDVIIIEGEAKGVDTIAKKWAIRNDKAYLPYPAKWNLFGKSAGFRRNYDMVNACDHCLIIWDGESKGTKHDIELCEKMQKPYKVVIYNVKKN